MTINLSSFSLKTTAIAMLTAWLLAAVSGCASLSAVERGQRMDAWAVEGQWRKLRLDANSFVLTAYLPLATRPASAELAVYIEGDGHAWVTASQPSEDPTPLKPVSLELALRHPAGAVAYLSRPCQNVAPADWRKCDQTYWTARRYSPEVIAATSDAITALKERFQAVNLTLVGYSGGGAVAALVAARRSDVVRLITVAANLDTEAWTRQHRLSPLTGSLNPADAWADLQDIAQVHFAGEKDAVVSPDVVRAYTQRFPVAKRPALRVVPQADHSCCWADLWPALALEAYP